jgi:CRP-like cAMP-binding protein
LVQLRCLNFMACTLEERVAGTFLKLSENFAITDGQGVRLTVPGDHQDVAELVGATTPRG